MVSLSRAALLALVTVLGAGSVHVWAQTDPALTADTSSPLGQQLAQAEQAYLQAEFEQARDAALTVVQQATSDSSTPPALLARAWDLLARCRYNLGDRQGMNGALEELIAVAPAYTLDAEIAGPELVQLLEERRRQLVGRIALTCTPVPCEKVQVDGREATRDAAGQVLAVAGPHTLTVGRRSFAPRTIEGVEVRANQTIDIAVELVQTARNVVLQTKPPGVEVFVDGQSVGVTQPSAAGGVSAPFELSEVPPGQHYVVLERDCFRRVEEKIDVAIDRMDPGALNLGTLEMTPSRGFVEVEWSGEGGFVTIDGQRVESGRQEICPGRHRVTLEMAGRTVWFKNFELRDRETVRLEPEPRATIAAYASGGRAPFSLEGWNVVPVDGGFAGKLAGWLERRAASVPAYPQKTIVRSETMPEQVGGQAPSADLVLLWVEPTRPMSAKRILWLVDLGRGIAEGTGWDADGERAKAEASEILSAELPGAVPFVGIDLADRRNGPPVITAVHSRGSAARAGLREGLLVTSLNGEPLSSAETLYRTVETATPGSKLRLGLGGVAEGSEPGSEVEVEVLANLPSPTSAQLRGRLLLPLLARAAIGRVASDRQKRAMSNLWTGAILFTFDRPDEAARALDRADLDATWDPSGDARGTLLLNLARSLRRSGNDSYAVEVITRLAEIDAARYGGRRGPPLSYSRQSGND